MNEGVTRNENEKHMTHDCQKFPNVKAIVKKHGRQKGLRLLPRDSGRPSGEYAKTPRSRRPQKLPKIIPATRHRGQRTSCGISQQWCCNKLGICYIILNHLQKILQSDGKRSNPEKKRIPGFQKTESTKFSVSKVSFLAAGPAV